MEHSIFANETNVKLLKIKLYYNSAVYFYFALVDSIFINVIDLFCWKYDYSGITKNRYVCMYIITCGELQFDKQIHYHKKILYNNNCREIQLNSKSHENGFILLNDINQFNHVELIIRLSIFTDCIRSNSVTFYKYIQLLIS